MNITNIVVKGLSISALMAMMVGCASLDAVSRNQLKVQSNMSSDGTDFVYGSMSGTDEKERHAICAAIQNSDPKCTNDDYLLIGVNAAFGFAAGGYSAFTWIPKDFEYHKCSRVGDSDCTFAKVRLVEGRYAEFVKIASENKDGKCKWSGLPRAGGTVCPAYNWDYRKNLNEWDTTNGITTIKKIKSN